jgi:hypothetical protein
MLMLVRPAHRELLVKMGKTVQWERLVLRGGLVCVERLGLRDRQGLRGRKDLVVQMEFVRLV